MKASVRDLSALIVADTHTHIHVDRFGKASTARLERLGLLVPREWIEPGWFTITAGGRAVVERLARYIPEACALEGVEVPE